MDYSMVMASCLLARWKQRYDFKPFDWNDDGSEAIIRLAAAIGLIALLFAVLCHAGG